MKKFIACLACMAVLGASFGFAQGVGKAFFSEAGGGAAEAAVVSPRLTPAQRHLAEEAERNAADTDAADTNAADTWAEAADSYAEASPESPAQADSAAADVTGFEAVVTAAIAQADANSVSTVVKRVANAVVSINVKASVVTRFGQIYEDEGAGSGIIIKEDGDKIYIATNFHVIDGATSVTVSLDDAHKVDAHFVGSDEAADLAVIYIDKQEASREGFAGYGVAAWGDSSTVEVGDMAVAIGNALGEGKSATLGIISALEKEITVGTTTYNVLQTDAAINPGNSGGALVNGSGQVIGVNSVKLRAVGVEGMGYAIPSNYARNIISNIIDGGASGKPVLGISNLIDITEAYQRFYGFTSLGVYVSQIEQGSTASEMGMKGGDIITAVNGQEITTSEEIGSIIQKMKAGQKITVTVVRDNRDSLTLSGTMKAAASKTQF